VLERLAATSDAERRRTTTVRALASSLGADEGAVETHLDALAACGLARKDGAGRARVTITGEELLELDPGDAVVVDVDPTDS
jgi:DNA-binding IclR family transcriptional regulator